jgi:hypothetical protein
MRIITREGRDALRRTAYDATARDGALALMPDVLLTLLDHMDQLERERDDARKRLANRVEEGAEARE